MRLGEFNPMALAYQMKRIIPQSNKLFALSRRVEHDNAVVEGLKISRDGLKMQNEELRRAELALRDSRNKYYELYDFAPVGYFTLNQEGVILELNITAATLLNLKKPELINKPFHAFVEHGYIPVFEEFRETILKNGTRKPCEVRLLSSKNIYVILEGSVIAHEQTNEKQLRMAVTDITERKRMEETLTKTQHELELKVLQRTEELVRINTRLSNEILERKEIERLIRANNTLLKILTRASSRKEYLNYTVKYIKGLSGCMCAGIRVLNKEGEIPYEAYIGFSDEFRKSENWLSVNRDQCACIRVITGKLELPDTNVMTENGSFYCADIFKFIDELSQPDKTKFRGVCPKNGFRFVAVIPIRYKNRILGVIHLADKKETAVSFPKIIELIEALSSLIGEGIQKFNLQEKIRQNYIMQSIVNSLLRLSLADANIEEILQKTLDMLLSISWFEFEPMGRIFLTGNDSALVLKAQKGFPERLKNECSVVPLGRCLCGQAAAEGKIIFSGRLDTAHEIKYEGIIAHGHYCVPIIFNNKVLGVINLYLKAGSRQNQKKEEFLTAIANSLAEIIQRKETEQKLKQIEKELEHNRRLSDIGTLAATVAHELRNPLGVIRTAAYNLKRKSQNPLMESHFYNIEKKILESDQIINNLLFYSRIRTPHYESVRIYDILKESITSTKSKFTKWDVLCSKKIESIKEDYIEADSLQMSELFNNILTNAFEAFPDKRGRISITARKAKDMIEIIFSDNGPGIDSEDLKRIFEPFFTTKSKGTGLGLSVCYQIVNLHKGNIEVKSIKNKGTNCIITLPPAVTKIK